MLITTHHGSGGGRFRHYALTALGWIAIVFALGVLAHVSWNMFAPDLFGLPEIRMKQALGLVVFAGLVGFLLTHGLRPRRHRHALLGRPAEEAGPPLS